MSVLAGRLGLILRAPAMPLASSGWTAGDCASESPMVFVEEQPQPPCLLAGQRVRNLGEEEMERLRRLGYAR